MGAKNQFLENNIPVIYRKSILDVMIYSFIGAQRSLISSITVEESAIAFLKYYNISEDELSLSKVTVTFWRVQKELINEQKGSDS